MDTQQVEVLGRNHLVEELIRADLEVSLPIRDRGIDLVAYADLSRQVGSFCSRPIQLKANSIAGFSINKKYATVADIIVAFVWNLNSRDKTCTFALTFPELFGVADAMGYTKTASWAKGTYIVSKPGKKLVGLLEQYRASSERWWQLVVGGQSRDA